MAKICPNCKTKNPNKSEFCQSCGQDLGSVTVKRGFNPLIPIIIIIIVALPLFFIWTFFISPSMNDNYLDENGINGTAEILDAEQTQTYVNNNPEIKFTLLVSIPGREPYKANYTTVVPYINLAQVQPGAKYYVLVDPKNPQNLKFA
ncbi:MAG: hypothetical protein LUQ24_05635 [Methanobacterium sp.]|nr:hypothetical protein [Methanobacterium sp.]